MFNQSVSNFLILELGTNRVIGSPFRMADNCTQLSIDVNE